MSIDDFGAPSDIFVEIDGVRCHTGISFVRQPAPGEDEAAFTARTERLAARLRSSGMHGRVIVRQMMGANRLAFIDLILEPRPAPLPFRARGQRAGRQHAVPA